MDHVTEYYLTISLSELLIHLNADPQKAYANEDHWVKPRFDDDRRKQGQQRRQRAHQRGGEASSAGRSSGMQGRFCSDCGVMHDCVHLSKLIEAIKRIICSV